MNGGGEKMDSDVPITSVPQLLAPHDLHFIHAAYQALLGRAPDAEGEAYYLTRLRAGDHKLEILKQLRRSAEGKAFIPGVAGLDRALRRHGRANLPVVGPVIRLFNGAEGDGATHRQLRMITNELARLQTGMRIGLAQLNVNGALENPMPLPPAHSGPPVTGASPVIRNRRDQAPAAEGVLSQTGAFAQHEQILPLTRRAQFLHAKLAGTPSA